MSDIIRDLFQALNDEFTTIFSGVAEVKLGYKDERLENASNITYPVVVISMYDVGLANGKRYSGVNRVISNRDDEAGTADSSGLPIPINFYFQADIESEKREDDWNMMEIIIPIMGSNQRKITTDAGRVIYLVPESFECLDKLRGSVWSKAFRFYVTAWMDHPDEAQSIYTVLERRFSLGPEPDWRPDAT